MRTLLTIVLLFTIGNLFANTIIVGKNKSINTLRQGIKSARDGDTVLLNKGVYREGNIIIDKAICLIGVDQPVETRKGEEIDSYFLLILSASLRSSLPQLRRSDIKNGLNSKLPGDLLSLDIRRCLYSIGEITGEISNEDTLDYIFSKFCIGK